MDRLEALYQLYEGYEKKAEEVHRKAPRYAGILGLGNDPRDHECHGAFYEAVGQWVQDFQESDPPREEIARAVRWILEAADTCRDSVAYGYLYAAQGHVRSMLPQLSREDCAALLEWYDRAYPVADRMPVQQEISWLLQKQAGAAQQQKKKGFLQSLFGRR